MLLIQRGEKYHENITGKLYVQKKLKSCVAITVRVQIGPINKKCIQQLKKEGVKTI